MKIWPPPSVVARHGVLRFPFVIPSIPPMEQVAEYFEASRALGRYSNFGPNNCAFEADVRARYAPEFGVSACTSCTAGLTAALLALGVEGAVLIPGFTFPATRDAVRAAGLRAVMGDVDARTGVLSAGAVAAAVRDTGIGAVVAVRPYGIWSDLSELAGECRRNGVALVIDNASGFGVGPGVVARYGLLEAVEVFSLHATKPAAIGEGGLLIYPPAYHEAMRAALNFGMTPGTAEVRCAGVNGKLDEIRAAVGRAMLEQLPGRVRRRQAMAALFVRHAQQAGMQPYVRCGEEWRAPWHCFPVRLPEHVSPGAVVELCASEGLQVRRYYHPVLAEGLPGAAALAGRSVCLPVYDGAEWEQAEEIWDVFAEAVDRAG